MDQAMKRLSFPSFLIGGILGVLLGVAIGFFIFPYVFPPPAAMETLAQTEREQRVAQGRFIHADPGDPVHHGRGGVTLTQTSVFLESDFEVGPGPAYHVYLVAEPRIRTDEAVERAEIVNLGKLRAFKGSQNYAIPDGVDVADYRSVVIWCEQFSVLISPADLQPIAGQSAKSP